MLQMSHCLRSLDDIESCIRLFAASYVPGKQSILISIYTHWNKPETIREMIRLFCAAFPEAEIAGMTTAGGIDNGRMRLHQTVITIQFFEKSDVHTAIYDFSQEPMEDLGEKARSFCQRQKDLSAAPSADDTALLRLRALFDRARQAGKGHSHMRRVCPYLSE